MAVLGTAAVGGSLAALGVVGRGAGAPEDKHGGKRNATTEQKAAELPEPSHAHALTSAVTSAVTSAATHSINIDPRNHLQVVHEFATIKDAEALKRNLQDDERENLALESAVKKSD